LGFGGDIILRLQYPIVITPNTSMSIYETTFEYSNCSAYGETADIYVSKNNIDYFYLDQTCLNTNTIFDLYNIGLDSILYVKIKDVSDVSKFSNYSFLSDGYDLDGIIINENGPLPIILKRFGVDYSNNILRINFITSSESNTYKFVIQSSIDASNFQDIIEFVAAGYSSFDRVYQSQMDFYPIGDITYFRLVEFDINGDIFYFDIIFVKTDIKKNSDEFYYDIMGRRVSYNYNSIIILKSKF